MATLSRQEAARFARTNLDKNGLSDWHVIQTADLTRNYLGLCVYKDKSIFINAHHVDTHPVEEVENTILHEVAHALTPGHSHDDIWAAKAKELGCTFIGPCAPYGFDERAIDAIRSGHTVEVTFDEQVVRTPKYTITRLQDKCPTCGKVAKEKSSCEVFGKKIIFLECGHSITKTAESFSPFESIVFDGKKDCKHEWNKTVCALCNAKRLYPYQVEGAKFLEKSNGRAAIFDEMGLGKTAQTIAWIKYHPEAWPVLFIGKANNKYQWSKELVRMLGFEHMAQVIQTSRDCLLPGFRGYIITYDILIPKTRKNHKTGKDITSGFDINKFKEIGIKTVVLDECQQIKNPDATRTQMVRRIVKDVPHVIPLSGTPWKNRGSEFFPVLNMLNPVKFSTYQGFIDRWVDFYWQGDKRKMGGIKNPARFKEYTADMLIRRERAIVMPELPAIQRNAFYCEMDETTQQKYNTEVLDFAKFWNQAVIGGEEDSFENSQSMIARLTRMRHLTGLAKIPQTVEFAKEFLEETDRKLVIFTHHIDVAQIIFDQLSIICAEEGYPQPLHYKGGSTPEVRDRIQTDFNGPNYRIMVASTLASGEAINLQTCSDCVMHERQWNPGNEEQAEGRFIRIGQQATSVTGTYMLADGSIDSFFHTLVEQKRAQFHAAMNNGQAVGWKQTDLMKDLAQAIVNSAKNL